MDFTLNETQTMMQDGARRLFETSFGSEKTRTAEASAEGFSTDMWTQICELGFAGAALPEDLGGGGCGRQELAILAEELGRAAVSSPLVATSGLAATILQSVDETPAIRELLAKIASSDVIIAPALAEPGGRDEWSPPSCAFAPKPDGGTISGTKALVPFAEAASELLVSLSEQNGELLLVRVAADAHGLTMTRHQTLGANPLTKVAFDNVSIPSDMILARGSEAQRAIEAGLNVATVLAAAEAVGNCEKMVLLGAEYAATREQFGQKIGSFQAVAHPLANLRIQTDALRLLVNEAAWLLDQGEDAQLEIAAMKVFANEVVVEMIHAVHAVHGAIGYTMEYDLQLFTRRARAFCLSHGDTELQTERAAEALGL